MGGCGCVEPGLQTQIQWRETHCRQGCHTGLLLQRDKGYVCKYCVSAGGWNLSNPDTNGAEESVNVLISGVIHLRWEKCPV